ncbi:hypothetical protein CfE428DRAFT_3552 [Chthoniobacter flavus Ellin428]|uniref:Peptidase M14 carboxypeptidase A domain-containing protein n=1 Tax=Chthoniobacter flavus Ellin428 TaxID=497964 RepID=B4D3R4_9BACT|nr:hypothetical protein [Chthoniobacter flavus]EDY18894.1 hypothetical protein CfE428DRAFT_3552 [Chthoniobacter flavus Ellin428]TCO93484.1 hypothetical protein EV701_104188 [Chthoniobacter flavus]
MSRISIHTSPHTAHPASRPATAPADSALTVEEILAPLHAAARDSLSLVASRQPLQLREASVDVSKFLVLGQRGSGQPIRLGLFAGFEAGNLETVQALARLLLLLKESTHSSRDFALFGYPVVNVRGFTADAAPLADFEARFARDSAEADVQFFKHQLHKWRFNGLISLRTDSSARGFYAAVHSELIASEVVEPALAAAAAALPLATQAVKVRPGDRYARTADYATGRFSPPADVRPYPFEIELYSPRGPVTEDHTNGLFVALTEILRLYRTFIAHKQDL